MSVMVSNQTHVGCMVARIVLGASGKQFQKEVERLIEQNGIEWSVNRFKTIRVAALHLRNGDKESATKLYQANSIAYHKGSGLPKGAFKPAVKGFVDASRPSIVRKYDSVLRIYTSLIQPTLTPKQGEKAVSSIQGPRKGSLNPYPFQDENGRKVLAELKEIISTLPQATLRDEPIQKLKMSTSTYSREKLSSGDRKVPVRQLAWSLLHEGYVPEVLHSRFSGDYLRGRVASAFPDEGKAGRIAVIQEQGAKARVVAVPSARLQHAFLPLHSALMRWDAEHLGDTSCVSDQLKGIYGAMNLLDSDHKTRSVYCTDLSSATDRFPRSVSQAILRGIGLDEYATALAEVSERKWSSPWGDITYSVGQPMGLYGSFPLFHISNQLVAEAAERVATRETGGFSHKFQNGKTYYVLGDDIIHSDSISVRYYRETLSYLGCDVSPSKTIDGRIGEFAGFVLDGTRQGNHKSMAYRPYKVPSSDGPISNPVSFLANLGRSSKKISPWWSKQFDLYAQTRADRSPDLSPWFTQERENPNVPSWDAAVLDNEFLYLVEKYSLAVDLDPNTSYASGTFRASRDDPGFQIIGRTPLVRTRAANPFGTVSRDPKQQPDERHPSRIAAKGLKADPLMRKARLQHQLKADTSADEPDHDSELEL